MSSLGNLKIAGTGSYLPDEIVPNSFFEGKDLERVNPQSGKIEKVQKTSEEIFKTTGIKERRKSAPDEWPSDMGYLAAVEAINRAGINASSLVGIIVATVTEKSNFPSAACKIQEHLGVRGCFAKDISNACAGFPEGLNEANSRFLRRPGNYLVIGAEALSKIIDYNSLDSTLFGDGAGAAVLVPAEEGKGILGEYSLSNPFDGNLDLIFKDPSGMLRMHGNRVFKKAVSAMLESVRELKSKVGWDRVDVCVPHQANGRILRKLRIGIDDEYSIVYENMAWYGNMGGATCPIALHGAIEDEKIKDGSRVIVTSLGSGLVTAATAVQF